WAVAAARSEALRDAARDAELDRDNFSYELQHPPPEILAAPPAVARDWVNVRTQGMRPAQERWQKAIAQSAEVQVGLSLARDTGAQTLISHGWRLTDYDEATRQATWVHPQHGTVMTSPGPNR